MEEIINSVWNFLITSNSYIIVYTAILLISVLFSFGFSRIAILILFAGINYYTLFILGNPSASSILMVVSIILALFFLITKDLPR